MKVLKKNTVDGKIKAVVYNNCLVVENTIPYYIDKGYPCMIINSHGASCTTGDFSYWINQGGEAVYEGETVEVEY